ncbi:MULTISPECIES: hypothetical protein [Kitasatospora]|uniref:Uncharacterized protein n=1 Tax=Kitasatospora cystarginea TaxID=58350 RepID=A0ABN3F033_9ACTN
MSAADLLAAAALRIGLEDDTGNQRIGMVREHGKWLCHGQRPYHRFSDSSAGPIRRLAGTAAQPPSTPWRQGVRTGTRSAATGPGGRGRAGAVRSWSTETEFLLAGGKRKVRLDGVWQAPETGVPVLMVEVDRFGMAPARVAAKFTFYRELFRTKVCDSDADRAPFWTCWSIFSCLAC